MSAPKSPPPGSVPSGIPSPDVQSMMNQFGATTAGQAGHGSSPGASGGLPTGFPGGSATTSKSPPRTPRPVGTPLQEMKYLAGDVTQGVLSLLPDFLQNIFHIRPTDSPEEQARKKQMFQRYQQLNAEQQEYVQKKYKEEHERKQREEQERIEKEKQKQAGAHSDLPMPTGKKTGAGAGQAGASRKKSTIDDLNKKRQQLSSAG